MTTESLDTNILLRLALNDIPRQNTIAKKLITSPHKKYLVADVAISEMVYVLETGTMSRSRKEICDTINFILAQPSIICNRDLFKAILPFYLTHPKLSFNDCYLSAHAAHRLSEPLWTFDRKLAIQSPTAKQAT